MNYEEILEELVTEPMELYHSKNNKFLSSHKLSEFRDDSPMYYRANLNGQIKQFVPSQYLVGTAAHTLILEGVDEYEDTYSTDSPINKSTGRPYKRDSKKFLEWCEIEGADPELVLTYEEDELIRGMNKSCQAHPQIKDALKDGVAEKVIRAEYHGVDSQIRPDWFCKGGLYDLKTCADLNYFIKDARYKYNYLKNKAFYRSVFKSKFPNYPEPACHFIAVEKRPPYRAAIFLIDPYLLDHYEAQNDLAIEELIACRENEEWPTKFEGMQFIEAKDYENK